RLQDHQRSSLYDPVLDHWDTQRPLLTVRLGNVHPPHGLRTIRLCGVLPPVHPATAWPRRLRCRRTSGHPRPPLRRWPDSSGRRARARPVDTPCHTGRRSGNWVPSSLWHATSPATSQPWLEVVGSSPISRLSLLRTLAWNQGPFPPPALPSLDGTMGLSDSPSGPACPSRASGWLTPPPPGVSRVASVLRVQACRRHYPGGTVAGIGLLPGSDGGGLPQMSAGSAPATKSFRGLLGVHTCYGLPARGVAVRPFPSKAPAVSLPLRPLRLLLAGATVARWELHPLKNGALARRTDVQ